MFVRCDSGIAKIVHKKCCSKVILFSLENLYRQPKPLVTQNGPLLGGVALFGRLPAARPVGSGDGVDLAQRKSRRMGTATPHGAVPIFLALATKEGRKHDKKIAMSEGGSVVFCKQSIGLPGRLSPADSDPKKKKKFVWGFGTAWI